MKNFRQLARRSGSLFSGKQDGRGAGSRRASTAARILRSELLEKRELLAGDIVASEQFAPQHNYLSAYDVNNDGQITALDALVIVNELGRAGVEGEDPSSASQNEMFFDVNADLNVTALDALTVINAVGRGEGVDELIELQLRALADPNDINSELTGPIAVGETFHLEISYDDLRPNSLGNVQEVGAFQLVSDILVSEGNALVPVLHEVQNLFIQGFANANGTTGIFDFDSVEFSATIDGQVITETSTSADFNASVPNELTRVLGVFGFEDDQFSINPLDTVNNRFGFQIVFAGSELANVDVPNISFEFNESNPGEEIDTEVQEIAPFLADGTTPNPAAVPFAIDTNSRTFRNNDPFFDSLIDGSFDLENGFSQIRGVGQLIAGGVPAANNNNFQQPFDSFSIPVQLSRPVQNLVISVAPSNVNEAVLLYLGSSAPNDASVNVPASQVLLDDDAQVTLSTIAVANPGVFSIDPATLSVDEDAGNATFTINRTGGVDGEVTIAFATSDGSATAGSDYTATNGTLTFADGQSSMTVTVPITDDGEVENDETFNLTISSPTGGATVGAANSAVATIVDNDVVVVNPGEFTLSPPTLSVNESGMTASFTVTRSGGTDGEVTVDFATANGTATAGSDFTANNGTLTFGDGVGTMVITVDIIDDAADEMDETFTVAISNPTGGATLGAAVSSTATIIDNDEPAPIPGEFSIDPASVTVDEADGTVTFTVNRTVGDDGAVSVDFTTNNGTATAGSDFTANNGTLNFADGETSQTITVAITDDDLEEQTENFTVSLSSPTGGATLGAVTTSTVSITDNDAPVPGTLSITPANQSVNEDAGTATLIINRTGGSDGPVSVSFATIAGSATAGSDFEATSGTVNFADGQTSQTITINILDDSDDEPNETFTVAISSPMGGASLGTSVSSSVTILDDDEPVVNNPPTSGPVTVTATEDIAASFAASTILANASPGTGEVGTQTVSISNVPASSAQGGSVVLNSDGSIAYQAAQDFNGTDSFVVTITDDAVPAETATFTVTVNVAAVNDDPVANNDTASTTQNQSVNINVLANDNAGPANEDQTLSVVASSAQGSVVVNSNNTLTFTPVTDFIGTATIDYTITDSDGAQDSATVTVTVEEFTPVTISGTVFIDNTAAAGNVPGVQDLGFDRGIGGLQVRLVSSTNVTVASVLTDLDGGFEFTNVAPGDFSIVYDIPDTLRVVGPTSFPVSVDPNVSTSPSTPVLNVAGTQNTGLETINLLSSNYLRRNQAISEMSSGGDQGGSVSFDAAGNQELFIAGDGFEGVNYGEVLLSSFDNSAILVIARDGGSEVEVAALTSDQIIRSSTGRSLRFFGGMEDLDFAPAGQDAVSVDLARFQAAVDRALLEL